MLEQKERIRNAARGARFDEHLLRGEPVLVFDPAQPADMKRAQHQPAMFLASGRGTAGAASISSRCSRSVHGITA